MSQLRKAVGYLCLLSVPKFSLGSWCYNSATFFLLGDDRSPTKYQQAERAQQGSESLGDVQLTLIILRHSITSVSPQLPHGCGICIINLCQDSCPSTKVSSSSRKQSCWDGTVCYAFWGTNLFHALPCYAFPLASVQSTNTLYKWQGHVKIKKPKKKTEVLSTAAV